MAPEQLLGKISRAADIYAASVVLWEALTCVRLFDGEDQATVLSKLMERTVANPSSVASGLSKEIDAVVARGLAVDPAERYATAREMAREIETHIGVATASEVGEWVERLAKEGLDERLRRVAAIENVEIDSISSTCLSLDGHSPSRHQRDAPVGAEALSGLPSTRADHGRRPRAKERARWPTRRILLGAVLASVLAVGVAIGHLYRREARATTFEASSTSVVDRIDPLARDPEIFDLPPPPVIPQPEIKRPPPARPARSIPPISKVADRARAPSVTASPDCDVPYTLDVAGIRHPRPECL